MIRALLLCAAVSALGGCASLEAWSKGADLSSLGRGEALAQRECARCHAIGNSGQSPRPGAPNFGQVRVRHNELSLMRELEAIAEVGHYSMPPLKTEESDRRDLIAYIESLGW